MSPMKTDAEVIAETRAEAKKRKSEFFADDRRTAGHKVCLLAEELCDRLTAANQEIVEKDREIERLADAVVDLSTRYHFAVIDLVNAHNSEDLDEISKAVVKIRSIAELIQNSIKDDGAALSHIATEGK